MERNTRRYIIFFAMLAFIVFWTSLIVFIGPKELVSTLGVGETHLAVFLLAVFGALSSLTTFSIYPALGTFAAGGMNPVSLGIIAGIGLTIGDSFFFLFGRKLRILFSESSKKRLDKLLRRIEKRPRLMPLIVYAYVAFTPFPNNVLTGGLALTGYRFRKLILPLWLGDMTLPAIVSMLAAYSIIMF